MSFPCAESAPHRTMTARHRTILRACCFVRSSCGLRVVPHFVNYKMIVSYDLSVRCAVYFANSYRMPCLLSYRLDGLLDESDFLGSEGILTIELLVDALYGLDPNCWRLLMNELTLAAPSIGDSSNIIK